MSPVYGINRTSFDFIVVGGGQSGLVVASRLSEDVDKTVVVIEAGSDRQGDTRIDTPGLMTTLYDDPDYDWKHMTVPQSNVNNRQISWPRGKVLGGTSAMNFSALVYPAKSDFDNWATLVGDQGWNSQGMASYLKRFHNYQAPNPELKKRMMMHWVDEEAQGYDGPLPASFTNELGAFNEAWMRTFAELGLNLPGDPISGDKQGAFQNPLSIENGVREYSASAYYNAKVAQRPNLTVITNALVERIVLEEGKDASGLVSAKGVQLVDASGERQIVQANKEVIVACGAIKSPQLLELSGIGAKHILSNHGIEAVINNAHVGENLQDHVLTSISFEVADDQISGDIMRDSNIVESVVKLYQDTRTGPLSGTPLSFAYTPLVSSSGIIPQADVETLLRRSLDGVSYFTANQDLEKQYKLLRRQLLDSRESSIEFMYIPLQLNENPSSAPTDMTKLFSKSHDGNYITLVTMLMHPFSRGETHITSGDPKEQPRLDPQYLSHPIDIEMLARALLFVKKIAKTNPLALMLKPNGRRIPPVREESPESLGETSSVLVDDDLEDAKRIVRERLFTAFHPSGTCAMFSRDQGGVVDSRLRVHGSANIRVVDASIFPIEPLGHLQSTVYAVAEKAADLIKADWTRSMGGGK
ncbi:ryl-alcohol dehydrogenase protein [Diaporthe amygdali]|uniref:ryl-alcohol dehydrogenase protein n=1 Tax=Phomopsis amygdali TaxID=1214568 RepID=UPI0022FE246E|nr:ryl-alcohol dehydrogenase protein [Diaporthe amygdali]KAJ0114295.1 ryl-alcohol dehydrogenase protein [Diaporthe amygdali]